MNYTKMVGQFVCKMAMPLALMFAACSDNGNSVVKGDDHSITPLGGSAEETGIVASLSGVARRQLLDDENIISSSVGPGSVIKMSELDSVTFDTTGVAYFTRCVDSTGAFSFDSIALNSPYVMLELAPYQEGEYWDWDGVWSFEDYDAEAERYLAVYNVIIDVRKTKNVDIDVMTYLETARLRHLLRQGVGFDESKQRAGREVLNALGMYGESFDYDKSKYVENGAHLIALNYVDWIIYDWMEAHSPLLITDMFGETASLSAVDSIRDYFASEIYRFSKIYRISDSDRVFLGGFLASLYGLGECSAEKEGFSSQEPIGGSQNVNISCGSGKWTFKKIFTASNAVNATFGVMTDARDGKNYKTVTYPTKYQAQTWLAENLRYESTDGLYTMAAAVDLPDSIVYLTREECVESYENQEYCQTLTASGGIDYVRLRESEISVKSEAGVYRGVCPEGWHLPSADEWMTLLNYLQDALGEEDKDYQWNYDYLGRAGFEESEADERVAYVLSMDDLLLDYYIEWEYEKNENWAVAVTVSYDWKIISRLPDDSFSVRCLKDE